jgi:Ca-activated chloride channel family protein
MDLSALQSFHFLRPAWLLALPPLLGLTAWLARRHRREGGWNGVIDSALLERLRLAPGGRGQSPWPWLALAWTIAVLALAGPSWQRERSPAYRAPGAWVLVLDLSPSMAAEDLAPDRATRARYAIDDLLSAARDARVALIVFSDEAYTVTPLTDDVATVRALLPPLAPGIMPSAGDHLAPALTQAGKLIASAGTRDAQVVVLSDGFDDPSAAFVAAQKLRGQGATLSVVGIGTAAGAPVPNGGGFAKGAGGRAQLARLDADRLRRLATAGGGRYVEVSALPSLIAGLQAEHASLARAQAADKHVEVAAWRDAGAWLLPAVLVVAALLARRGWL